MKRLFAVLIAGLGLLMGPPAQAQNVVNKLADFGLRRQTLLFEGDTAQFVVLARPGDEQQPKPVFLYDAKSRFGIMPFNPEKPLERYHLVSRFNDKRPPITGRASRNQRNQFNQRKSVMEESA